MLISKYRIWYQKRDFLFSVRCWVMCSTQEKDSGDQNPGVYTPDCMLASLRKRGIAPCLLPPFLWILYFSWLRGAALMGRGKISQPGEPITGCSTAQQSQGERCCWITPGWSAGPHRTAVCLKDRQTSPSYTLKRSKHSTVWKISELPYVWFQSSWGI